MWFVVLLFLILYIPNLPPGLTGYDFSDMLITIAHIGGIGPAPGYPVYLKLLGVFTHLGIGSSIAFRAHLFTAILSSLTLGFVYRTVWLIIQQVYQTGTIIRPIINPVIDRWTISLTTTILLGTSYTYWLYSLTTNPYIFTALLAIASLFTSLLLLQQTKPKLTTITILGVLIGIGLQHHHSFALLLPAFISLFIIIRSKLNLVNIITLALTLVISFSVAQSLVSQPSDAPYSWSPQSISQRLNHYWADQYTLTNPNSTAQYQLINPHPNIEVALDTLPVYVRHTTTSFSVIVVLIILIGFFSIFKQRKSYAIPLSLAFICAGPLYASLMIITSDILQQSLVIQQYLLGYTLIPLILAPGLYATLDRIQNITTILTPKKLISTGLITFILACLILWPLFSHYQTTSLKHHILVDQTYAQILDQIEPNSVVFCFNDVSCGILLYAQQIQGKNPQATIIGYPYQIFKSQIKSDHYGYLYPENPMRMFEFITWNLQNKPIYVVDLNQQYYHMLSLDEGFFFYIPQGIYGQITRVMPDDIPQYPLDDLTYLQSHPLPPADKARIWLASNLISSHAINASILIKSNQRERAREELNQTSNAYIKFGDDKAFETKRNSIELGTPSQRFTPGQGPLPAPKFIDLIKQWQDNHRYLVAHKVAIGAIATYPQNPALHVIAGQTFQQLDQLDSARHQYQYALQLDPNNTEAQNLLDLLDTPPTEDQTSTATDSAINL